MECYGERMALMLEGVELLDTIMAMVDEAAEKRAGRVPAQPAPSRASKPPKPSPKADAEGQTSMLLAINGPEAPVPNGIDGPGR
jgi:hypothetical protein